MSPFTPPPEWPRMIKDFQYVYVPYSRKLVQFREGSVFMTGGIREILIIRWPKYCCPPKICIWNTCPPPKLVYKFWIPPAPFSWISDGYVSYCKPDAISLKFIWDVVIANWKLYTQYPAIVAWNIAAFAIFEGSYGSQYLLMASKN